MKVFSKETLLKNMVEHPYDTNQDLVARVNFFFRSEDGRLTIAYYESPAGWFDVSVEGFSEIDYVLEGEVQLSSRSGKVVARKGEAFLIEDGDSFRWHNVKPSKMLFFIYPVTKDISDLIDSFYSRQQGRRPSIEYPSSG
ncbi:MAG: hypothetical protein JXA25_04255 [Anaerolineales bacterium]|nr:hypothetical protein [Anaerolineales bacterium]